MKSVPKASEEESRDGWIVSGDFLRLINSHIGENNSADIEDIDSVLQALRDMEYIDIS